METEENSDFQEQIDKTKPPSNLINSTLENWLVSKQKPIKQEEEEEQKLNKL